MSRLNVLTNRVTSKLPRGYGRGIVIIAWQVFTSTLREKRFYLAALYYLIVPVILTFITRNDTIVQTGTGIALFYAHFMLMTYVKTLYLSFLLGQVLLVILAADQIAGEIEQKTFTLLRTKPIYDSEIMVGKFLGMAGIILLLDLPGMIYIYFNQLFALDADYPSAFLGTIDELVGAIIIVFLIQCIIIAMTLFFSSLFAKSLYGILSSLLTVFLISTISDNVETTATSGTNYFSVNWVLDAFMPYVLYHLEPLEIELPSLFSFIMTLIGIIAAFLAGGTLLLRRKELF